MLDITAIRQLGDTSADGDKARIAQAQQNAAYIGETSERWILKEAIRLSKPYGLTMTPREMLEYLRSDDDEGDDA